VELGKFVHVAFKELDPIPQFRATAKLAPFMQEMHQLAA